MSRCKVRDRYGHRCNVRGKHLIRTRAAGAIGGKIHTAFGREWVGSEKRKDGPRRIVTAGWSRRGIQGTREELLAATMAGKA